MKRFRLDVAYDGTRFEGWQIQARGRTVQGELEKALAHLLKEPVKTVCAGRTDSGVHARGQVVHFDSPHPTMVAVNFFKALNTRLPRDIRVTDCRRVSPEFHARYSARLRRYHYYLRPGWVTMPWESPYSWPYKGTPDLDYLNAMAAIIVGEHDFTTFSAAGDTNRHRVRRVESAAFFYQGPFLVFRIAANAFLWRMVRSLVGSLIEFESKGLGPAEFRAALEACDRKRAGSSAPAQGLFLEKVYYDEAQFHCGEDE